MSAPSASDCEKRERMSELARTFPSLAAKLADAGNGLDPFDAERLAAVARGWSDNEQQVATFLLTVWNARQDLTESFNVVQAMRQWDDGDRQALVAWALRPFSF